MLHNTAPLAVKPLHHKGILFPPVAIDHWSYLRVHGGTGLIIGAVPPCTWEYTRVVPGPMGHGCVAELITCLYLYVSMCLLDGSVLGVSRGRFCVNGTGLEGGLRSMALWTWCSVTER